MWILFLLLYFIYIITLSYPIPFSFQRILSLASLLFHRCHSFLQHIENTRCVCVYLLVYMYVGDKGSITAPTAGPQGTGPGRSESRHDPRALPHPGKRAKPQPGTTRLGQLPGRPPLLGTQREVGSYLPGPSRPQAVLLMPTPPTVTHRPPHSTKEGKYDSHQSARCRLTPCMEDCKRPQGCPLDMGASQPTPICC